MPHPPTTSTETFLRDIDEDLVQYGSLLISKGYTNTRVLAHLTLQDISELPIGHKRLLINEVNKIRSPHSKALLTALDCQELQTSGANPLQPKELFPNATCSIDSHGEPSSAPVPATVDWRIFEYEYSTPMDKHLNRILDDIEIKETEITKVKAELESVSSRLDDDDIDSRPCCSLCHERGHKKNKCTGSKCLTSISCGRMRLHKDELKQIDASKNDLKKLLKEKSTLESECERIRESIRTNNRSFPQAVRSHLVNSNKPKYLAMYGQQIIPLTKVINLDLSILQKFYDNKVPHNLDIESEQFEAIIAAHTEKFKSSKTSINAKIMDNVRRIESRVRPAHLNAIPGNNTCITSPVSSTPMLDTSLSPNPDVTKMANHYAYPAFGQFSNTPTSLAQTPFIPLVALQSVDNLTSSMGQLTSPTRKRGKFNDPVSTPRPTSRSLNPLFSKPVAHYPNFDSMKSSQLNYTPQFQTPPPQVPTPPPQFQTPTPRFQNYPVPHSCNSHVNSSNLASTWYSKPVGSPRHPKVYPFLPPATNTMKTSTSTLHVSQVECKSEIDEGAKSATNRPTPLDNGEGDDYSAMFDEFNVKPKVRLYRRFTADQWACEEATTLQTPDLD